MTAFTHDGRSLRPLTLIDEFTRQCLANVVRCLVSVLYLRSVAGATSVPSRTARNASVASAIVVWAGALPERFLCFCEPPESPLTLGVPFRLEAAPQGVYSNRETGLGVSAVGGGATVGPSH